VNKTVIKKIFDQFNSMTIMVIGDVMIDAYMWGKVERISPEAPIPIVSVSKKENRPGGAANVALNIQSMGARPVLCSIIGSDPQGDLYLRLMREKKMETAGIMVRDDRTTTVKTRIIGSKQQLLRVDEENNSIICEDAGSDFITHIGNLINTQKPDAIIFEDYDKGVITPDVITRVLAMAHEKGIPVSADPKKRNFNHYRNIDLFTPNLRELSEGLLIDIPKSDIGMISRGAGQLQQANGIKYLMVTLSELGIYLHHDGRGQLVPAEARDIADVSGAGDTVISVATVCLAAGMDPGQLTRVANLAGGLVCGKIGVVPVDKQQLLNEALRIF
jgi:D-glycero-beta-D-manno-heptose-7-phosphate kinase